MLRALLLLQSSTILLLLPVVALGQQKQIEELAATLTKQLSQRGRKVIAVSKFTNDDGFDDRFGRYIAGHLTTELGLMAPQAATPFKVVDRAKIEAVLNELNLQYTKPFDAATFSRFGSGTGADTIITGDFRVTTNRISLNCIALDMSMQVLGGSVIDIPRTPEVDEYLGKPSFTSDNIRNHVESERNVPDAPRSASPRFQNQFVRAELVSLSKSPNGQQVTVTISLQNLLREDLYIAFEANYFRKPSVALVDDQSTEWQPIEIRGIQQTFYSGPHLYPRLELSRENYTAIPADTKITVVARFSTPSRSEGKIFSFTADGLRYDAKSPTRFSIGLTDVSVRR